MGNGKVNNLNRQFKLNTRLVWDRLDTMGKTEAWLAEQCNRHYQTIHNTCVNQRIPSAPVFDLFPGILGVTKEELLLPLVEAVKCG